MLKPLLKIFAATGVFLLLNQSVEAETLCQSWQTTVLGHLPQPDLKEASGLAISKQFNDRLYHVNDSGDGPFIYVTKFNGALVQKFALGADTPVDVEDLSLGPCSGQQCLYVADIGDNNRNRQEIAVTALREKENFSSTENVLAQFRLRYPDHPHDAESFSVHPNGDIFILSKEYTDEGAGPAQLFYISAQELWNTSSQPKTLHQLGSIDLPFFLAQFELYGQVATGMNISPNGQKLVVITYEKILEFAIDLSQHIEIDSHALKLGTDYSVISANQSLQQEAVSYLPNGDFLYTAESHAPENGPLKLAHCLQP